eukprot:GHRQ01029474.1.p1 GENE.GHRQ01029474.1~~GHRQ01029474.1.p1  ORF type:complete len:195 (+),score=38.72 GHRQ01029474.1:1619-2203(+)
MATCQAPVSAIHTKPLMRGSVALSPCMLQADVKSSLLLSPASHYRGYQPLGLNVTRHEAGFTPDWHEALDLFREEDPAAVKAAGRPQSAIHGPNLWPDQVPGFSSALRAYINACLLLGNNLLRGIAMGLGLPEGFFAGQLAGPEGSYWVARVIHYPPLQHVDQQQKGGWVGGSAQPGKLSHALHLCRPCLLSIS